MKFINNNKDAIIFYTLILVFTIELINDVKKDNLRENNKYVTTYMPK